MSNIKDLLTTICGWVTVIGGAVLAGVASGQIILPATVTTIIGSLVGIAVAVTQFLTGKNPDGSTKSTSQVTQQNSAAK